MVEFDAAPLLVSETASVLDVAFKHSYGQTPLQFQRRPRPLKHSPRHQVAKDPGRAVDPSELS
jgi:hypothetical protein